MDFPISKIDGQAMDENSNKLKSKLSKIAANIPTSNEGGSHRHVGMISKDALYQTFSIRGQPFTIPTNPGPYPTNADAVPVVKEHQVAEHKAEMKEFKMYLCIENALRIKIKEAVDKEWFVAINSPTLVFTALAPMQILTYLLGSGSTIDFADVTNSYYNSPLHGKEPRTCNGVCQR